MKNFKKGDKVKINYCPYNYLEEGGWDFESGEIMEVSHVKKDCIEVFNKSKTFTAPFYESEIELFNAKEDITESQNKQILNYLQSGATISPITALNLFDSFRLSARINDLRNEGHNIKTTMVYNGKKRWANYNLVTA